MAFGGSTGSTEAGRTADGVSVFVSYRRDDVPDAADRLTEVLRERLGNDRVFLDVDNIEIGADFADVIGDWVGRCDVLLAVVGRGWLEVRDPDGRPRIEDPDDYVRLEIEAGLQRNVRVVPVLIHGAVLPTRDDLPESLVPLLRRNAKTLSRDHWSLDVDELIAAIQRIKPRSGAIQDLPEREAAEARAVDETTAPESPPGAVAKQAVQQAADRTPPQLARAPQPDRASAAGSEASKRRSSRRPAIIAAVWGSVAVLAALWSLGLIIVAATGNAVSSTLNVGIAVAFLPLAWWTGRRALRSWLTDHQAPDA